eukprot:5564948-Amphidinium_carterae.1
MSLASVGGGAIVQQAACYKHITSNMRHDESDTHRQASMPLHDKFWTQGPKAGPASLCPEQVHLN